MATAHIHQIFYDEATRHAVEPAYIPLDNTQGRADWYEFWPIKQYLDTHSLVEGDWYGFLSTKFREKTGFTPANVHDALRQQAGADVLLLSGSFDQLAFFKNPFEQGDAWHPGLMALAQRLLDHMGVAVQLQDLVCHSHNFAYCNYIVAKPAYWRAWHTLAQAIWAVFEADDDFARELHGVTRYHSAPQGAPIKTFIQERMPALLLQSGFQIAVLQFDNVALHSNLFANTHDNRALLRVMDRLKREHGAHPDAGHLAAYQHLKPLVELSTNTVWISDPSIPHPLRSTP